MPGKSRPEATRAELERMTRTWHEFAEPARERLAYLLGQLLKEAATSHKNIGNLGAAVIPVENVRGLIFALTELAVVLAVPDGKMRNVAMLAASLDDFLDDSLLADLRREIGMGMAGTKVNRVDVVDADEDEAVAGSGNPIGQA